MKTIKISFRFLFLLSLLSPCAFTQSFEEPKIWANGYGGAGIITDGDHSEGAFHLGVGAQGLLSESFGLEADVGYLASFEYAGGGIGVFCPGVFYRLSRNPRTMPFLEGGYSLFFRSGTGSGVYFGGGVNHWFNNTLGFQLAARDQLMLEGNSFHVIEVRLGLLFK